MFKFLMYKFGQFIIRRLTIPLSYRIAVFLSDLHYLFSFRDRKAVRNNLKVIVGESGNLSIMTREVFRNFGRYLVEFFLMDKMVNEGYIKKNIKFEHLDRIEDILKKGKGGIILTAHLGNWELGGALLSALGFPITAIALPHKERPVNDLFNHQREVKGIKVVAANMAVRKCLETLRSGQFVALLADRDFNLKGELLSFLGHKIFIPKGAAIFSIQTQAPILPIFLIRQPDNSFILSVEEPIFPLLEIPHTIEREALLDIMEQYTRVIERKIRQFPTQWLMFREFWVDHGPSSLSAKKINQSPSMARDISFKNQIKTA